MERSQRERHPTVTSTTPYKLLNSGSALGDDRALRPAYGAHCRGLFGARQRQAPPSVTCRALFVSTFRQISVPGI